MRSTQAVARPRVERIVLHDRRRYSRCQPPQAKIKYKQNKPDNLRSILLRVWLSGRCKLVLQLLDLAGQPLNLRPVTSIRGISVE